MAKQKNPTECPKCGTDMGLYLRVLFAVNFLGVPIWYGREAAQCNSGCGQRFWWYPESGRITRRNTESYYDSH
jgi:hypothetical protein